jgi:hypothetical protein
MTGTISPDGSRRGQGTARRAAAVARHLALLAVMAGLAGLALRAADGAVAPDLATLLRARYGLALVGDPLEAAGRTVFLAAPAETPAEPSDVYVLNVARGADGRITSARALRNLTRSRYGDETNLAGDGARVAFGTRIYGRVETLTVMDFRGDDPALTAGWQWLDRAMDSFTSWQETGALAGIDVRRFELAVPAPRVDLRWGAAGGALEVRVAAGAPLLVDPATGAGGGETLRYLTREKGRRAFIHWFVDTVRDGGYLPDGAVDWAKSRFYSVAEVWDWLRYKVGGVDDEIGADEEAAAARTADASDFSGARLEGWPPVALHTKLKGVGWHPAPQPWLLRNAGAPEPFYLTTVRPYDERPGAWFDVVEWDTGQVELHMVAGTREPMSATGHIGTGKIPRGPSILRLLGTFNGGFQGEHGNFGMMVDRATLLPPKDLSATVALFPDGSAGFGSWPVGLAVPASIVSFRQNLSPLVALGLLNPHGRTWWGTSVVKDDLEDESRTTRTGVCLTDKGKAAYIWARRANWRELAEVMKDAGCTYGVHLDMNPGHCGAEFYRVYDPEAKKYDVARMTERMGHMNYPRWIKTDARDFFYLTLRPVLPSAEAAATAASGVKWSAAGLPQAGSPPSFVVGTFVSGGAAAPRKVTLLKVDPARAALEIRAGAAEPESTTGSVRAKGGATAAAGAGAGTAAGGGAGGGAALYLSLGVTDPVKSPGLMAGRSILFPPRAGLATLGVRCTPALGALGERTECRAEVARWGSGLDLGPELHDFKQGGALVPGTAAWAAAGFDADGFLVLGLSEEGDATALGAALKAAGVVSDPVALDLGGRTPALWAETAGGARRFLVGDDAGASGASALRLEPRPHVAYARLWEEVDRTPTTRPAAAAAAPPKATSPKTPGAAAATKPASPAAPPKPAVAPAPAGRSM